jgi:predicted RNA-binding Zn ribbon-like protein
VRRVARTACGASPGLRRGFGAAVSRQWAALRPFALDALAHAELAPRELEEHRPVTFAPTWPEAEDLHAVLWPIAHAAVDLLTSAELSHVKHCAGCPWLFLDRSKNASRRWCAMNDCGTHAKIRRYVARRSAARASVRGRAPSVSDPAGG